MTSQITWYGTPAMNYFSSLALFKCQGRRDNKITAMLINFFGGEACGGNFLGGRGRAGDKQGVL